MKTKTFLLLYLLLSIGLTQLSAQKSSTKGDVTILGAPAPVQDKMNGKVQKVVLKFYWIKGTDDKITKGKSITTRERDSLGWFYDFEATFDKLGDHIITYNSLDDNGNPFTNYQFIRENNRIVMSKWSMGKDTKIASISYAKGDGYSKYINDENGYNIATADYKADGDVLIATFQLKNNEFGDEIEVKALDSKGNLVSKWSTSYDEKRQVTGGDWAGKDGNIIGYYKTSYNDKGKVSEVTYYDKDKKVTLIANYAYPEYDAKGNWLKLVYKNSIGQSVFCERKITYF